MQRRIRGGKQREEQREQRHDGVQRRPGAVPQVEEGEPLEHGVGGILSADQEQHRRHVVQALRTSRPVPNQRVSSQGQMLRLNRPARGRNVRRRIQQALFLRFGRVLLSSEALL